jgi:zinc protease
VLPLRALLAFALLAITPLVNAAPAAEGALLDAFLKDVKKQVLPNGLTLITRENPGSGVVAINTWVKAGYFNEPDEVAGMAHLFEHMFFKGSARFPGAEQISREIAAVGGQTNAGTIYDSTNYYIVVPKEGFRRAVEIQADAVINPLFDPAELRKEAEVVIEESNRKRDNASAMALEGMFATQFTRHRMRRWRIGSDEVLRNINRDDLLAFFGTLYRPENIVLSIAGDISHDEATTIARETFGAMPRGTLSKQRGPTEPRQEEFRYGGATADTTQGYSVLGWQTVGVGHPDEVALDVLASILGQGRSSRLFVNVVGPGSAATSSSAHYTFDDVGVLFVQSSFDEGHRGEADRRVIAEIERIKAHGPTAYELQRAKNGAEASVAFALEDALGQAQTLANAEANYGYDKLADRLRALNALQPEDITRVARQYLDLDRLTLYHYAPNGTTLPDLEAALAAVRQAAEPVLPPLPATPAGPASSPVERATASAPAVALKLDNGMTLLVQSHTGAPVVSTAIYFPGGRTAESSRNAGITRLMARSLQKGTRDRSGAEIDRGIEFLGTELSVDVNADYFGLSIDLPSSHLVTGLELLSDMLLHPSFPADGVEAEKRLQVASIRRNYDSATQRPLQLALGAVYGNHPYGLPSDGYESSLAEIGAAEVRDWWSQTVAADGAVVVVVGDVSADAARRAVEAAFAGLRRREAAAAIPAPPPRLPARLDVVEHRDRKQSALVYAYPGIPRSHADWPRLRLVRYVTSGLAGTFFAELRGRRSLAYTVFATDVANAHAGAFFAYIATDAGKEVEARDALLAEIRRLDEDGFTAEDLALAQRYFAGSTKIALETNGARGSDLVQNWFSDLPLDFTLQSVELARQVTVDELREVAGRYLDGDQFVLAVLRGRD